MIYKHFTGSPRPSMPDNVIILGEIITQHVTRTTSETWYSDSPLIDQLTFNDKKESICKYNQSTMPAIWS